MFFIVTRGMEFWWNFTSLVSRNMSVQKLM